MKKIFLTLVSALVVMTTNAAEMKHGPWRLSVGPAWRSRAKSTMSGTASVTPVAPSFTVAYDQNIAAHGPWNGAEANIVTVTDPLTSLPTYAATATRTETTVTPNSGTGGLSSSDEMSSMGLKSSVGYDVFNYGAFSFGLSMRFAAYWNMRSSVRRSAGGGTTTVSSFTDHYLFDSGPYPVTPAGPGWSFFFPSTTPDPTLRTPLAGPTTTQIPASPIRARITSDLYQVGLGPTLSWHVFDWLDAYAGAAALCNLAHMDFEVNGASTSSTVCRFGAGGDIGAVAWLADDFGLYAEVGYEWIDESSAKIGRAKANTDFSSLTLSTGVIVGF